MGVGGNRWSLVHREDAAELYRLVLERRGVGIFHAVDGRPLTVRQVAEDVGRAAAAPGRTRSLPLGQARGVLGPSADALCLDQAADASRSLGWGPRRPDFFAAAPAAFEEWRREMSPGRP